MRLGLDVPHKGMTAEQLRVILGQGCDYICLVEWEGVLGRFGILPFLSIAGRYYEIIRISLLILDILKVLWFHSGGRYSRGYHYPSFISESYLDSWINHIGWKFTLGDVDLLCPNSLWLERIERYAVSVSSGLSVADPKYSRPCRRSGLEVQRGVCWLTAALARVFNWPYAAGTRKETTNEEVRILWKGMKRWLW